jgi:uncharacterized protein (DUF2132 family)
MSDDPVHDNLDLNRLSKQADEIIEQVTEWAELGAQINVSAYRNQDPSRSDTQRRISSETVPVDIAGRHLRIRCFSWEPSVSS